MLEGTSELQAIGQTNIFNPKISLSLTNQYIVGSTKQSSFKSITGFELNDFLDGIYFSNRFVIFGTARGGDNKGSTATIHTHGATWLGSSWSYELGATITMGKFVVRGNTLSALYLENCTNIKRISSMDGVTWAGITTISTNRSNSIIGIAPISDTELYTMGGSVGASLGIYQIYYVNLATGVSRSINSGQHTTFSPQLSNSDMNVIRKGDYDVVLTTNGFSENVGIYYHISDTLNTFKEDYLVKLGFYPDRMVMGNISSGISYYYLPFNVAQSNTTFVSGQTIVFGSSTTTIITQFPKSSDFDFYNVFSYRFLNRGVTSLAGKHPVVIAGSTNQTGRTAFEYYYITDVQFPVQIVNREVSVDMSDYLVKYSNINNDRINITLGNYN